MTRNIKLNLITFAPLRDLVQNPNLEVAVMKRDVDRVREDGADVKKKNTWRDVMLSR